MNTLVITSQEGDLGSSAQVVNLVGWKDKTTKICYISLNSTYHHLIKNLQKEIDIKRLFVIDFATNGAKSNKGTIKNEKGCLYLEPPNIIKELEWARKKINFSEFKYIIIDSVSAMMEYHTPGTVIDFLMKMINSLIFSFCDFYFLTTRPYYPIIFADFKKREASIMSTQKNKYLIKFSLENLVDILQQLEIQIGIKNKKMADLLYKRAQTLYRTIKKGEIDEEVKKQLYRGAEEYGKQINMLPH